MGNLQNSSRTWDLVGGTPLVELKTSFGNGSRVFLKLEYLNPGGSVKDRAAKEMIWAAEQEGKIKPGDTLVEGTAGNTGIGLASLGIPRGYQVLVFMPNNQSPEKALYLEALGAQVIQVPPCPFANPDHFYHRARRYAEENESCFWVNQFENLACGEAHFKTTGPEIWRDLKSQVDVFVASAGTGGTLSGVSRFLKMQNPQTQVVLADPNGSGLFRHFKTGEMKSQGSSVTEGIGIMRLTENFKRAIIDDAIEIGDEDLFKTLDQVAKTDGILLGLSAALNVSAAFKLAQTYPKKNIVTIACDHGTRYLEKIQKGLGSLVHI